MDIAIETDNPDLAEELTQVTQEADALTAVRRGADGATLTTIVVSVTPAIAAAVAAVIRAQIAARRYVRVTRKGMVIQGISEETLLKLLEMEKKVEDHGKD